MNNFGFRDGTAIIAWIIDITDSQFDANPGGYTVSGHQVTVDNSTFSNSREDWIYSGAIGSGYSVSAYNSTFTNNGNAITSGGQLYVENCVLNNNGEYRYAIQTGPQSVGIIKNTIIANNLEFGWGGVGNTEGTLSIINSTITGNILGVITEGGNLFVTNSTVSGNNYPYPSNQYGAGIYSKPTYNGIGAQVVVTNSTIVNNNATWEGGGIRNSFNCSLTLRNSIVAGNTASDDSSDIFGTVISEGNNLIGNTTGSTGWIASDLLNVNPLLGSLANNGGPSMTHALLNGSPAIDAGNNSLAVDPQTQMFLSSDQRGFPRLVGVAVDIGAYESTQTSSPVIAGTVTYGNSSGLPRFVSGVLINAITSPNVFATTLGAGSGQGTYLLTGFGSGSQTVTATKTGGVNGISSFDAGLIALHVAGITPLTGNQLLVTDTSGNGTVSSFDAGQVASYAAAVPGSGSTGNWIFIPANRYYPSVTSNITGEHFVALLMGEVSGNWTDGQNHRR